MTVTKSRRKRGGGRAGNAGRRGGSSILQLPWHLTTNIDMPTEPLNEEGVTAIHLGAMEILEEIGLEILNQEARDILKKAGCLVSGENVKFDREFIMEILHHEIQKRKLLWVVTKYYLGMFPLHQITGIQKSVEKCLARERLVKIYLSLANISIVFTLLEATQSNQWIFILVHAILMFFMTN